MKLFISLWVLLCLSGVVIAQKTDTADQTEHDTVGLYLLLGELLTDRDADFLHNFKNDLARRGLSPDGIRNLTITLSDLSNLKRDLTAQVHEIPAKPGRELDSSRGIRQESAFLNPAVGFGGHVGKMWLQFIRSGLTNKENLIIDSFIDELLKENLQQQTVYSKTCGWTLRQSFVFFKVGKGRTLEIQSRAYAYNLGKAGCADEPHWGRIEETGVGKKFISTRIPKGMTRLDTDHFQNAASDYIFTVKQLGVEDQGEN